MEEEQVGLTLKIPADTHTKLKILSAIKSRSMTNIITEMIDNADITYPSFTTKAKKPKTVSDEEKEKTKKFILELKEKGMSLGEIVKKLNEAKMRTMTGQQGTWRSGTISKMLKRWGSIPQNGE